MRKEKLLLGESDRLDCVTSLASDEEQKAFLRTVVAFANGAGGRIVLGVEKASGAVIGVPAQEVVAWTETAARLVDEGCAPEISMSVLVTALEGRRVIVCDVFPASELPCRLRARGPADGVFVRAGAETRAADAATIQELEFRGRRQCWDCVRSDAGGELDTERLERFCRGLHRAAQQTALCRDVQAPEAAPDLAQLQKWRLVDASDGRLRPTRGFEILEGTAPDVTGSAVHCQLFMGATQVQIGATQVYAGPLIEQFERTMAWLQSKLEERWVVLGRHRYNVPELPETAIRELLVNALCHRSWFRGSEPVTVALYRDRLEITSPGGRPNALSQKELASGNSSLRNPAIAQALAYCRLATLAGGGQPRAAQAMRRWLLKAPEVTDLGSALRAVLHRSDADWRAEALFGAETVFVPAPVTASQESEPKAAPATDESRVLAAIRQNPAVTTAELVQALASSDRSLTARQIRYLEDKLKAKGRLIRQGRGGGRWVIPS